VIFWRAGRPRPTGEGALSFQVPRPGNHRLRRGIYLLPTFFTAANLFCGYRALLATLNGGVNNFDTAARFIGLAILFDALDGRIARFTGTSTELGKQFDSLADVISFGIAPAVLAYTWGAKAIQVVDPVHAMRISQLALLACFGFLTCCAWRLARFNVQGMAPGTESRYFVGMPTPAAAGMIAATVHAMKFPLDDWHWGLIWFVLVGGLAALMASTIRYYAFKDIQIHRRQPSLAFVVIGLLVAGIFYFSEEVLLVVAVIYTFSGFTLSVVRFVRHWLAVHREAGKHPA
jgi:CDP-diacylglycerol--serine O-phosphatidyltransferase